MEALCKCVRIFVFLQDGLHFINQYRKYLAKTHLLHQSFPEGTPLFDFWFLVWVVGMRCILHVAQSDCKWGLAALIHDTASHDAHSTIKVLGQSSTAAHGAIDEFIRMRVVFQDDDVPIAERIIYWQILGVTEQRFLDAVVDINPRFDFERKILCVRASLADDDDQEDKIRGCVHYFLQWTN